MKSIDPQKMRKLTLAEAEAMAKRDKRRMIAMGVLAVGIIAAFAYSRIKANEYLESQNEFDPPGFSEAEQGEVFVPDFDQMALLDGISDSSPEQRLTVDETALQAVLKYTLALTRSHFESLTARDYDEARESLMSAPSEHRLESFRVRGEVIALKRRLIDGASDGRAWFGTLKLESGEHAHFYVDQPPQDNDVVFGGWARLDGLFLQLHNTEVGREWIDAPLLVGREVAKSYPYLELGPDFATPSLEAVTDDVISMEGNVFSGIDPNAKWELMAKALQADEAIDWENAPELTVDMINAIYLDGEEFRGKPFRLPISINMDTRIVRAEENPLHLERITEGWIGNYVWKGKAGSIQWWGPWEKPELLAWRPGSAARYVTGRGFFLKNYIYTAASGKPERTSLFVMSSVDIHTPQEDGTPRKLMWGVFAMTTMLIVFFTFLLMRDKRQSQRLQDELLRRKRARRERLRAQAETQLETS